jgi:hypothetical protein
MLGRLLILIAMMLTGPLFIEVYLYHPTVVLEHDKAAMVPLVVSPLVLFGGFLLLAADNRLTAAVFGFTCVVSIATGVIGTAIHVAMHTDTLLSLATDPNVWLGQPPILVPLSFAAAGCLGLIPLLVPGQRQLAQPPVAIGRILAAMAAVCALVAMIAGAMVEGGTAALFAVIAALGFGSFGFMAEIAVLAYPFVRDRMARRGA